MEIINKIMVIDPLFDVSQETVIITGVSGQIGYQYALAFLDRGSQVVGLDIKLCAGTEFLISKYPTKFCFINASVSNKKSLEEVRIDVVKRFGNPTVLINNAAIDSPPSSASVENGPFEDYPEESWDKVIEVNLKGVYLCCQVFGAAMVIGGVGSIINISSIYGIVSPDQNIYNYRRKSGAVFFKPVAYSASKSGILNLTRYLAVYWAKSNIRVNSLTIAGVFNDQESEFLKAYCGRIPVGRMANVDEYNGSVLYLASSASRYMTGANLVVDGGWTAI